jgi:NAD(P)-dependent dehydrogenase (short-subunit alcohol dehydrogenase family)
MDIAGKVFIVTGGASGLGEGSARMFVREGGKVVIADVQADKGESLAKELGAGKAAFVRCDVTQEVDARAVVAKGQSMGKLMGLVNCAGIGPAAKTVGKDGAHPLDLFTRTITINLIGSFNMIRLAAEAMSKNEPETTGERGVRSRPPAWPPTTPDRPGRVLREQGWHRRHDAPVTTRATASAI